MGLDMYAYKRADAIEEQVDFPSCNEDEEIFYWRKHPNTHGWMENLYREKGGKDSFNCDNMQLTAADLDAFERAVLGGLCPRPLAFSSGSRIPNTRSPTLPLSQKHGKPSIRATRSTTPVGGNCSSTRAGTLVLHRVTNKIPQTCGKRS